MLDRPTIGGIGERSFLIEIFVKEFLEGRDHASIGPGDAHTAIISEINSPQIRIMKEGLGAIREERKPMCDLLRGMFEEMAGIDEQDVDLRW